MRLSDCFADLIAYASYGVRTPERLPASAADLAQRFGTLIDRCEDRRIDGGFSREDFDPARLAVVVWIDETIMTSAYPDKAAWPRHLLQRTYCKTTDGGFVFYSTLDNLTADQDPVREVFLLCLALGYCGRYGHREQDRLTRDTLRLRHLRRLTGSSDGLTGDDLGERLFPEAYGAGEMPDGPAKPSRRRRLPLIGLALIPVGVFVFLFALYRFILDNETAVNLVNGS
ncbi:type VI secretion system protein TssL [Desulfatiferula olefinivorans]